MKSILPLLLTLSSALASPEIPFQRPEEQNTIEQQSQQLYQLTTPIAAAASPSTVWIWTHPQQPSAIGTVISNGKKILTKWSEISQATQRNPNQPLLLTDSKNQSHPAKITHISREDDLAILELLNPTTTLTPIQWSREKNPQIGSILVAAQPNGYPAGFGIVSVHERSLRNSDQAALGILADAHYTGAKGIRIAQITRGSAAQNANLTPGDIITHINHQPTNGIFALRGILATLQPKQTIPIQFLRNQHHLQTSLTLDSRTWNDTHTNPRLHEMERLGGEISHINSNFPSAIQTDMQLTPAQCGAPILDLSGKAVGIAIARTDRTRSFFIPAHHLQTLIQTSQQPTEKTSPTPKKSSKTNTPIPKATLATPQSP